MAWWKGTGGQSPPGDNFLGALKFAIANVKYDTKYVKSSLSTNSKIVVIWHFYSYSVKQQLLGMSPSLPFLAAQKPKMTVDKPFFA